MTDDAVWRDEERLPVDELNRAMATYSADGQVDDLTGNDAGAEEEFGENLLPPRPSPDGRTGPN
jgi:hypothetical protein